MQRQSNYQLEFKLRSNNNSSTQSELWKKKRSDNPKIFGYKLLQTFVLHLSLWHQVIFDVQPEHQIKTVKLWEEFVCMQTALP